APQGDAAGLGPGWRERIPRDLKALGLAWQQPGAWLGMTRIAGMDTPAETVGLVLADELAVHGWDVARSTRQPYTCEPDVLEAARQFLEVFASPDAPGGPEVPFGPATVLLPEAPLLDRVVALAGRDPNWSPPSSQPPCPGPRTPDPPGAVSPPRVPPTSTGEPHAKPGKNGRKGGRSG